MAIEKIRRDIVGSLSKQLIMEPSEIGELELWDYISKNADDETMLEVEIWINSEGYNQILFDKIALIYRLTSQWKMVTYNYEKSKKRLIKSIRNRKHPN